MIFLCNLIVAVKFTVIHFTPSGDVPLKTTSLPGMRFIEREYSATLGIAHVNMTSDSNVTFIDTGNSENTVLPPVES